MKDTKVYAAFINLEKARGLEGTWLKCMEKRKYTLLL